jgi:hypothetical protein
LVLGGLHGIKEYNAAVDNAEREFGFADYLPVGVPIWALVGAVLGALASGGSTCVGELPRVETFILGLQYCAFSDTQWNDYNRLAAKTSSAERLRVTGLRR